MGHSVSELAEAEEGRHRQHDDNQSDEIDKPVHRSLLCPSVLFAARHLDREAGPASCLDR